jgi:hypothetical protein
MAEKHKSKYKAPKDLEKSQKPKARKDLKDYTEDDKKGALNPKTTGDKQLNVLRKTDKVVQDDGKMYPKYNEDDRLYKDLEDADYDPKTAAKRLKKRQDTEEKETSDVLKDKLENLTREQKERLKDRLVREYIRRKINNIILERPTEEPPAEEPAPEAEAPAEEPAPTDVPAETPPADAATPTDVPAPAPPAPAPTDAATPAPTDTAAPAPTAPAPEAPAEEPVETKNGITKEMEKAKGTVGQIESLMKGINQYFKDADPRDIKRFYKLFNRVISRRLSMPADAESKENNK